MDFRPEGQAQSDHSDDRKPPLNQRMASQMERGDTKESHDGGRRPLSKSPSLRLRSV